MIMTYDIGDWNLRVSEHFRAREFRCKDGTGRIVIDSQLVDYLEKIRAHFKRPVIINSAYRTKEHNTKVGGSKNSQHLLGKAADIVVQGIAPDDVYKYCCEIIGNNGGVGKYKTFTHIDVRGNKARW